MMQRITNEMLELAGASEAIVKPRDSYEESMKALIHLQHEAEIASNNKDYEKIIDATSVEDRAKARKRVEELLRFAQDDLDDSDGEAVNKCIDAVFNAYFEDGAAGISRALKMLEE